MRTAELPETKSTIRFSAKLAPAKANGTNGSRTLLTLPERASARFPSQGKTMVEGTINGFPFRVAIETNGSASRRLKVNKAMQEGASASAGDTVDVEITRIDAEPETRVPADLRKALAAAPEARAQWAEITPMARRDWILWISSAKGLETRKIRIEKACDMLASGKRRVCCFGGLKWLTKDQGTAGGLWLPLPPAR